MDIRLGLVVNGGTGNDTISIDKLGNRFWVVDNPTVLGQPQHPVVLTSLRGEEWRDVGLD